MAQGDIYRFSRIVSIDGELHVNVMHFMDNLASRDFPEQELMEAWDDHLNAVGPENTFRVLQVGYTTLTKIGMTCQRIWPDKGDVVEQGFETGVTTALDTGLPTFAQTKFSIQTTRPGRSGRGGFYVGGIPEGETVGNLIDSQYQSRQLSVLNMFIDYFSIGGSQFTNWVGGVWSQKDLSFGIIQSISAATDIGTMRSRRAGRGV